MVLEILFKFILSFALILIAARIGGELAERYLKQPPVIGELLAGIAIGPFALGGLIGDPIILNFALVKIDGLEFSAMEVISQIAVIALLFVIGVETDVRSFLRHGLSGASVAVGGAIPPFFLGFLITMGLSPGVGVPGWLFMGAVLVATSISLTARILRDIGRLDTREGTTILVAAVVDDIIGIVVLSVVVSIAVAGFIDIPRTLLLGAGGFGVWFALLMIGVRLNRQISKYLLRPFERSGTMPIFAMVLGFLMAYLVTLVELHPIIGAYVAGLMFAATAERKEIMEKTEPIMLFLAPFFFAFLGMQVNVPGMFGVVPLTAILIAAAIAGKFIGCYIPARAVGKLDHTSASIVGIGMVPRAEVGLIVAVVGLTAGAITRELFGAAVAVSVITSLVMPPMLRPFLQKAKGNRD